MKKTKFYKYIAACILILSPIAAFAQKSPDSKVLMNLGDSLRTIYRFEESLQAYEKALDACTDSLERIRINDRILLSENGKIMSAFTLTPKVVTRHKFSLKDFFLYYPLQDKSWRANPNQLDSTKSDFARAVYIPDSAERIFYSAKDSDGIRNIYSTEFKDTVWSVPSLLNERMTSDSDEIYPMLSHDGKTLYFASEGLFGVGGYDLYRSEWNDETGEWNEPVNLGFPYSSPADDLLLMHTRDGKHTIFASNRDCSRDSVWVYVLEYEPMPVSKAVSDAEELMSIAMLDPYNHDRLEGSRKAKADIPENMDTRRYMSKMKEVRALRDSISHYGILLENARVSYDQASDESERENIAQKILHHETHLPVLKDSLTKASAILQEIEMEFLFSGVVIDPEKIMEEADREIVGDATSYTFSKKSFGNPLKMKILVPEPEFDYSFKILPQGQFAEDNTIPDGVVYQIQIFTSSYPVTEAKLKGLSPVFEHKVSSNKYIYRAGLFNEYKDVLSHVNAVKRLGFRSAFITAFIDGEQVSVAKAKAEEARLKEEGNKYFELTLIPANGEINPTLASGIRQQAPNVDIARVVAEDGVVKYIIGPFADEGKAMSLADFIRSMDGAENVSCSPIVK